MTTSPSGALAAPALLFAGEATPPAFAAGLRSGGAEAGGREVSLVVLAGPLSPVGFSFPMGVPAGEAGAPTAGPVAGSAGRFGATGVPSRAGPFLAGVPGRPGASPCLTTGRPSRPGAFLTGSSFRSRATISSWFFLLTEPHRYFQPP